MPSFLVVLLCSAGAWAGNEARPMGEAVLERPTLRSLGAYWMIEGDENKNATVSVGYRKAGQQAWQSGYPLFRVEKGAHKTEKHGSPLEVPEDAWLFAGSVVLLEADTAYELRLRLVDPDGGQAEKLLRARTIAEPAIAPDAPTYHVVPGQGGGRGTSADPFKGLSAAKANAKAGDVFLLHAGTYEGPFNPGASGQPGKPIVWKSAGDGEVIIDSQGKEPKRFARAILASGLHDVWFEGLTIRNADYGIVAHDSARIVVRRCHIHNVDYGFTATRNTNSNVEDFFIVDNLIEGPCAWPRSKGIENPRGIQVTGEGHVVAYNRIRNFADAIDTFSSPRCASIDFHNNDISEMTDDGIEMDYSQRNTRCFHNRLTSVYQGITVQPVYGGPVYVFRNAMYNVCVETFKMHNDPSGALMFHNTSVKKDSPLLLWTNEKVRNSVYRNNLFVGTPATYAYECQAPMIDCDFDYDGFAGGPFKMFLKWHKARFASVEEAKAKAPVYRHAVVMDSAGLFASGVLPPEEPKKPVAKAPDLRISGTSKAVDAGQVLPGFNEGYGGKAPDLGAYEAGAELPQYGPR